MTKFTNIFIGAIFIGSLGACNKYLNVVPDNVATVDYAFRTRNTAEKFLFTCYSYLPDVAAIGGNPAFLAGDEFWLPPVATQNAWQIARGFQKIVDPYMDFWTGSNGGKDLYEGIRECNIFLEKIGEVPDLDQTEEDRWIAEVKFLKAYYHFYLVRMYGPVILVKKNLSVDAKPEKIKKERAPLDSCFGYIVQLLDEALPDLPAIISDQASEMGRITQAIDLALKAKVLVTAASPLFNGNKDFMGYTDPEGNNLFNTDYDPAKWDTAAKACKTALQFCESNGFKLYHFNPNTASYAVSDTTITKMSIRNAVCEKWNPEIIWGNTNSMANTIQRQATPRGLDPDRADNQSLLGTLAPPLKIAEEFYTNKGLPITEDKTWDYAGRFRLETSTDSNRFNIKKGYITAELNFNREPRYYADLGFDGSIWYGQGHYNDDASDIYFVSSKSGDPAGILNPTTYSVTGYWPKKLVNYQNIIGSGNNYTIEKYPWPMIRLAELYLLYAEALNEQQGPGPEVYAYLDSVRTRAGIPTVEDAWTQYAKHPGRYKDQEGLREIIHQEILNELAFEGKRFWNLRRWKASIQQWNNAITGWDVYQTTPQLYYRQTIIYNQTFLTRDYLWPIAENTLLSNSAISQNPGW